ncbi:MAG: hypothetical protein RR388_06550 [Rikenellaceae bacterium]
MKRAAEKSTSTLPDIKKPLTPSTGAAISPVRAVTTASTSDSVVTPWVKVGV